MTTSNQALFSRPVLAILMVVVTLLIWILNATAPASRFAQPKVTTWQTSTSIPVIWLDQDEWQGTNKLEIRIRFNHGRTDDAELGLTDALFSLLLLDTLPLSTSSISKRLQPTGSKVDYHVSEDNSELALTLNSNPEFLVKSLHLLNTWLTNPIFKQRTFINWQQSNHNSFITAKSRLAKQLYSPQNSNNSFLSAKLDVTKIENHFQTLKQKVDKITLVGHLPEFDSFKLSLDSLLNGFHPSSLDKSVQNTNVVALHTQVGATLNQSHGALAIAPLERVTDWISLQIWLRHLAGQLHQNPETSYTQLHLERSNLRQWVWWSTQHEQTLLQDGPNINHTQQDSYVAKQVLESSVVTMTSDEFNQLLESLQDKIARQSKSPTWWARIASQETPNQQGLNLTNWLETYATELEKITLEQYQQSIARIVLLPSYQEIQIRN